MKVKYLQHAVNDCENWVLFNFVCGYIVVEVELLRSAPDA